MRVFILLCAFLAAASAASLGSERCAWGPSYWCDHPLKAKHCGDGATQYCIENDWARITTKDDTICDDCETFVGDFLNLLNNAEVQTDIVNAVKDLCNDLKSEATACQLAVDIYGLKFLQKLITGLDSIKVCSLLDLCANSSPDVPQVPSELVVLIPKATGDVCTECKQIFSDIQDILDNPSVQTQLFSTLTKVCQDLGIPDNICEEGIDQFGPLALQYLVPLLDGPTICPEAQLCGKGAFSKFGQVVANIKQIAEGNGDPCAECKESLQDLVDILNNVTVQNNILKEANIICGLLGIPSDSCNMYINGYGPIVFEVLTQYLTPEICTDIQLCSGQSRIFFVKPVPANQGKLSVVNGNTCAECKQIFTDLADILNNPSLQSEIFSVLTQECETLGLPANICDLISTYGPEAIGIITSLLDGDSICPQLHLCGSSATLDKLRIVVSLMQEVSKGNGDMCTECKEIFQDLNDILANQTVENLILKELITVCVSVGVPSDTCTSILNTYAPVVFNLILGYLTPDDCTTLGVCMSEVSIPAQSLLNALPMQMQALELVPALPVSDDAPKPKVSISECSICELVATEIQSYLKDGGTQAGIENFLDKVCSILPSEYGQECVDFIDEYTPMIIELLETIQPAQICQTLGLCSSSEAQLAVMPEVKVSDSVECTVCKYVMNILEHGLSKNSTVAEIETALEKVCSILPSSIRSDCDSFITEYTPEIIQLLDKVPPSQVCGYLNLCSSAKGKPAPMAEVEVSNAVTCEVCQLVMNELDHILLENSTVAEVEKALEKVCSILPSTYKAECNALITKYGDGIIKLLESLSPSEVCNVLGLCSSAKEVKGGSLCSVCDIVFGIIETQIESNKTLDEITDLIEKVCTVLPADLGKQCKSFLDLYGPMLLKLVVDSELSPNDICKDLKLCTSSVKSSPLRVQGAEECAICKEVITVLDNELKNNQEEILAEITKLCSLLPTADQQTCKNYISVYGSYIIQLILEEVLTPQSICTDLKFCSASNPCLQGPAYWCANMDNAKLCNTVDHCRRHAWN